MREYLTHTETHQSVPCPPPHQTGVGTSRPETTLDGVTFPELPAVPERCYSDPLGDAGRHSESVILWETCWGCDVESDRLERVGGSPRPSALSANVFQICSAPEFLRSNWPGGVDLAEGCSSLGWVTTLRLSAYHRLP